MRGSSLRDGEWSLFREEPTLTIVVSDLYQGGNPVSEDPRRWEFEWLGRRVQLFAAAMRLEAVFSFRDERGSQRTRSLVKLDFTGPNYGGERAWFSCPDCGRRCRKLYVHRALQLRCAKCARLVHASKSDSPYGRAEAAAERIRSELDGPFEVGDPLPLKPWGMHHTTYQRKLGELKAIEEALFRSSPPASPTAGRQKRRAPAPKAARPSIGDEIAKGLMKMLDDREQARRARDDSP